MRRFFFVVRIGNNGGYNRDQQPGAAELRPTGAKEEQRPGETAGSNGAPAGATERTGATPGNDGTAEQPGATTGSNGETTGAKEQRGNREQQ